MWEMVTQMSLEGGGHLPGPDKASTDPPPQKMGGEERPAAGSAFKHTWVPQEPL